MLAVLAWQVTTSHLLLKKFNVTAVNLAGPRPLNYITILNLRRVESITTVIGINFKADSYIGVAEMKNKSIDMT